MGVDFGWKSRFAILTRDADVRILAKLRAHGWEAAIEDVPEGSEYLIVAAERGGHRHRVALLYSSATANSIYQELARQVEHIFINGDLYMLESYAYGLDKPVSAVSDFHALLVRWNEASSNGKFAPAVLDERPRVTTRPQHRFLLSETPIEAIWLRLKQLQSLTLAEKMISDRARECGVELKHQALTDKAEGVAYALRNAADYFRPVGSVLNLSQRVLNLYYGSVAFAFAEMLASPSGPETLKEIEDSTKQGHGLYTLDGNDSEIGSMVVGLISSGFFPKWMKSAGMATDAIPSRKAKVFDELDDLPAGSWLTMGQLFASIPELSDLFNEVFELSPRWVTPVYDPSLNGWQNRATGDDEATTYLRFVDSSGRIQRDDIADFPGPISQISGAVVADSALSFQVAVKHVGKKYWHEALKVHRSPFTAAALIFPIYRVVDEYRMICVALLYALSIIVRYRPSVSRRVQEGDLDHVRVLIEAFLTVVERVLPEQFLEKITGQTVSAKQPGTF